MIGEHDWEGSDTLFEEGIPPEFARRMIICRNCGEHRMIHHAVVWNRPYTDVRLKYGCVKTWRPPFIADTPIERFITGHPWLTILLLILFLGTMEWLLR